MSVYDLEQSIPRGNKNWETVQQLFDDTKTKSFLTLLDEIRVEFNKCVEKGYLKEAAALSHSPGLALAFTQVRPMMANTNSSYSSVVTKSLNLKPANSNRANGATLCDRCGRGKHLPSECRISRGATCDFCNKENHLSSACRQNPKSLFYQKGDYNRAIHSGSDRPTSRFNPSFRNGAGNSVQRNFGPRSTNNRVNHNSLPDYTSLSNLCLT